MPSTLFTGPRALTVVLFLPLIALTGALTARPAQADTAYPVGTLAYALLDDTEFYAQADFAASVVGRLPHGALVVIAAEPQTPPSGIVWYSIRTNSLTGWIPGDDLTPNPNAPVPSPTPVPLPPPPTPSPQPPAPARDGTSRGDANAPEAVAARVVDFALTFRGSRYIWGGTTPRGFDCSGFVYYVLTYSGVAIGRSMTEEIHAGTRIAAADLRPGDLVYFQNTSGRGISHISIYIGNGKVVHAVSARLGVTVSNLWSAYWAAHYAGSVRIIR